VKRETPLGGMIAPCVSGHERLQGSFHTPAEHATGAHFHGNSPANLKTRFGGFFFVLKTMRFDRVWFLSGFYVYDRASFNERNFK
jgi:hypothetical protein